MSRVCDLSGKSSLVGNRVSHSKRRTKVRLLPNVQKKRVFVPSLKKWVTFKLSTQALKTVNKIGIEAYCNRAGLSL
jgi:large subunit ribosomal protein L28